jgi:hypothetical protein
MLSKRGDYPPRYRVVSYYAGDDVPVLLLALVDKGERADLSQAERNALRKELAPHAGRPSAAVLMRGRVKAHRNRKAGRRVAYTESKRG